MERPSCTLVEFLGATGTVTGSRFLVDAPRARVLVDCGLYQGVKELRLRNWDPFPVDPAGIDAVLLTHAHVDHSGYLPALARAGFRGPVFATAATAELCGVLLPDSGRLHEEDAAYANRKGFSKHHPALPLFTEEDAVACLEQLRPVPFEADTDVAAEVRARFRPAGHILGSATIEISVAGREPCTLQFSGDLGRPNHPVLVAPAPPGQADAIVIESTYGDRRHAEAESIDRLADAITRTAERGGVVLIPAFAVDRTEVILFHLRALMEAGRIPQLPVYVDSPMALAALEIYRAAVAKGADDVRRELVGGPDPFDPGSLVEARSVAASKAINDEKGPAIVVSASGMATGGRVLHHLERRLPDPKNSVVLVGFQAEGTRGRRLLAGERAVKMYGQYVPVRAEIVDATALSVHADRDELLAWLASAEHAPDAVYAVHGEPASAAALCAGIESQRGWIAVAPRYRERVRVSRSRRGAPPA